MRKSRLMPLVFCLILFSMQDSLIYGKTDGENIQFPRINELSSRDPVFLQYSDDVSTARIALAKKSSADKIGFFIQIYSYSVKKDESLIQIAARCAIPYDAIASLNRIASMQESLSGKTLLLPTIPGLYLNDISENPLETLLLSSFDPNDESIISFTIPNRTIHFIPDAVFNGTVRAFFLTPTFRFPLPQSRITSSFGMRKNPITGNLIFHKGIDLAAPRGTPVFSCADGKVSDLGNDPVYGKFIMIRHTGNKESLYGHLESIKIELHQQIKSGIIIGTVGSTGQSTGPHLHFEIHENGVPKNPEGYIKGY